MPSYEYEFYVCPTCKERLTTKKCPSCGIKTKGQGKVSARYRLIEEGQEKQKRTGWYQTKKEAESEYMKVRAATPKVDYRLRAGESYLFEDLLAKYRLENSIDTKPSTQYEKDKIFNKYILPDFGRKDIRNITKNNLRQWQTDLFLKTYKRGGENTRIANVYGKKIRLLLSSFLDWVNDYYDIPNTLKNIKPPKNTSMKQPKVILEVKDFNLLDIASENDILWNTIFCFLFHTGKRIGEVQALGEPDYKNGEVFINKTISKGKNGRPIIGTVKNYKAYSSPVDDFLITKMDKYLKWKRENNISANFLFGGENFIDIHQYVRKLKFYLKKAKIEKEITLHSFRHSYVSMLIDMDCNTKTVAEMIGDTEEVVAKTYSHLYTAKKQQTVTKLNQYLADKK